MITRVTSGERKRTGLRTVLALFTLFAAIHAVRLPLFEGPDEPDNLMFIRYLAAEGQLTQPTVQPSHELEQLGRGHMPPLWFLSMVPIFSAVGANDWEVTAAREPEFYRRQVTASGEEIRAVLDRPASRMHFRHGLDESSALGGAGFDVRLMRWLSIPWALIALIAIWQIAVRVTGCPRRAVWYTALAASIPQLQHLSGTITMDLMLAAWGALALYACVEWCAGDGRASNWAALAGVAAALAALTKLNGLVLVPACFAAAAFARSAGRDSLRPLLVCALSFALIAGPYYAWGWIESGHPLWSWRYQQISPFHTANLPESITWGADGIAVFAMSLFVTWFADFGWTAVWFPIWIIAPFGVISTIGVASSVVMAFGPRGNRRLIGAGLAALVIAAAVWLALRWIALGRERLGAGEGASTAALILVAVVLVVSSVFAAGGALRRRRVRAISGVEALPGASVALGFLLTAGCLILAAEVWFNLKFSQPQARHLYPFLPALIIPIAAGLERVRMLRAVVIVQCVLCLAAIPLLLGRMRFEGWNSSALWTATDLDRRVDPSLTEERSQDAMVEWVEPEHRSVFGPEHAPTLIWQMDRSSNYDVAVGLRPEMQNRPWRLDGVVFRAMAILGDAPRGSLEIPSELWSSLLPGTRIYVQVLALGEDGKATGRSTLLELRRSE